jgi:hypothetical protein
VDVITANSGAAGYPLPFDSVNNNKTQFLYRAEEMGTSGTITKVSRRLWDWNSSACDYNNFVVVLGYATNTTVGPTFSTNITGAQTVYSGTFSVPAGLKKGDWLDIPLSTPFALDSAKDLIVQISSLHGTVANDINFEHNDVLYAGRKAFAHDNTTDTSLGTSNDLVDMRLEITK